MTAGEQRRVSKTREFEAEEEEEEEGADARSR